MFVGFPQGVFVKTTTLSRTPKRLITHHKAPNSTSHPEPHHTTNPDKMLREPQGNRRDGGKLGKASHPPRPLIVVDEPPLSVVLLNRNSGWAATI